VVFIRTKVALADGRCFGAGDNGNGQLGVPGFQDAMPRMTWGKQYGAMEMPIRLYFMGFYTF
jgi:hypothetical protein